MKQRAPKHLEDFCFTCPIVFDTGVVIWGGLNAVARTYDEMDDLMAIATRPRTRRDVRNMMALMRRLNPGDSEEEYIKACRYIAEAEPYDSIFDYDKSSFLVRRYCQWRMEEAEAEYDRAAYFWDILKGNGSSKVDRNVLFSPFFSMVGYKDNLTPQIMDIMRRFDSAEIRDLFLQLFVKLYTSSEKKVFVFEPLQSVTDFCVPWEEDRELTIIDGMWRYWFYRAGPGKRVYISSRWGDPKDHPFTKKELVSDWYAWMERTCPGGYQMRESKNSTGRRKGVVYKVLEDLLWRLIVEQTPGTEIYKNFRLCFPEA
jgi:hypothetical protein